MIRVLQVVNIMDRAGLETMLMNYYRHIDRSKVQFDFLTHRHERGAYDDEIESMGGKIYYAPRLMPQNYLRYFRWMKQFFEEHPEYQIVHSHIDAMSFFPLFAAKLNRIPVRISHSHSSKLDLDFKLPIKYMAKILLPKVSNVYFSCGVKAGRFLYKNEVFEKVNNASDIDKFKFSEVIRQKKRKELCIDNQFVIGHVGRYCYIKNQMFLLDVFNEYLKYNRNSVLLLIGKGPDEEQLREKAKKMNLDEKVKFLIDRDDVHELYQTMDIFVMPSLFEGLPVVSVEAQINGLTCVMSDKISDEVQITDSVHMLSLKKTAVEWAEYINRLSCKRNSNAIEQIKAGGYDISIESEKLMNKYIDMYNLLG